MDYFLVAAVLGGLVVWATDAPEMQVLYAVFAVGAVEAVFVG